MVQRSTLRKLKNALRLERDFRHNSRPRRPGRPYPFQFPGLTLPRTPIPSGRPKRPRLSSTSVSRNADAAWNGRGFSFFSLRYTKRQPSQPNPTIQPMLRLHRSTPR
jgi:hypothetical protein